MGHTNIQNSSRQPSGTAEADEPPDAPHLADAPGWLLPVVHTFSRLPTMLSIIAVLIGLVVAACCLLFTLRIALSGG